MSEAIGASAVLSDDVLARLGSLMEAATRDGAAALPQIREFYDQNPEVWKKIGNIASSAQLAIAERAAGGNPVLTEAHLRFANEEKTNLAGADASPLEQLLAEHAATCWLARYEAQRTADQNLAQAPARVACLDLRLDRASRRYESALKTLAVVRKLDRPAPRPIDIATKLQGSGVDHRSPPTTRKKSAAANGVPVNN